MSCCLCLQFLSLLQNELIRDMVVIYTDKLLHTVLRFGVPVCGHPTIVHGGLTSAIFDEVGLESRKFQCLSNTPLPEPQQLAAPGHRWAGSDCDLLSADDAAHVGA